MTTLTLSPDENRLIQQALSLLETQLNTQSAQLVFMDDATFKDHLFAQYNSHLLSKLQMQLVHPPEQNDNIRYR